MFKANFVTRDGCSKIVTLPGEPTRTFYVPLLRSADTSVYADHRYADLRYADLQMDTRTYLLHSYNGTEAEYREQ